MHNCVAPLQIVPDNLAAGSVVVVKVTVVRSYSKVRQGRVGHDKPPSVGLIQNSGPLPPHTTPPVPLSHVLAQCLTWRIGAGPAIFFLPCVPGQAPK